MIKKLTLLAFGASLFLSTNAYSQRHDKGHMIEYKNPYWEEIKKANEEFDKKEDEPKKSFKMIFDGIDIPESKEDFKYQWHTEPVSQGASGMCWCYSTTSLFESEAKRLHNKEYKFSELYTVYWEYVEKARRFVREHGKSHFSQGSQANAVRRTWKKYGCVPESEYTGKKEGQVHHNHDHMFKEMKSYLNSVKERNEWNEEVVLSTIKSIMNHWIGEPPTLFEYNGKKYTPKSFLADEVKINPDDYIDIMSLMQHDYWKNAAYTAADNWWKSDTYNNVPLDEYMNAIKTAAKNGYTMFIGGDVSESGYYSFKDVAMVPSYDIPSEYIDENARQFRFSNKSTTDDHGIHLVGYLEKDGDFWFIIKDSGSGSKNGKNVGYYFYHEDYVKLKMVNFFIHKSAVEDLLKKMEK